MKVRGDLHIISVKTNDACLRGGEVLLDGKPMKGLTRIQIDAKVREATVVVIEMLANVDYQGEARQE